MNKAILIGNLTKPPELRTTQSGVPVCTFSIAVSRRFDRETADFFNIIAWRQLGEMCAKYLDKGRKVCVVGEIQNRSYEAKDGTKRTATEIVADEVEFLTKQENAKETSKKEEPKSDTPEGFVEIDDEELPF